MVWSPPEACDQCSHPIGDHVVWKPGNGESGWMHCEAPGCYACWHDWPAVSRVRRLTSAGKVLLAVGVVAFIVGVGLLLAPVAHTSMGGASCGSVLVKNRDTFLGVPPPGCRYGGRTALGLSVLGVGGAMIAVAQTQIVDDGSRRRGQKIA